MTNADAILTSLADSDAARFGWTRSAPVVKIVAALEAARPGSARFVGGCVRDSLIGVKPKDIDIATTLTPQAVIDALHAASLKAAPTGIDHGTITGIADHVGERRLRKAGHGVGGACGNAEKSGGADELTTAHTAVFHEFFGFSYFWMYSFIAGH